MMPALSIMLCPKVPGAKANKHETGQIGAFLLQEFMRFPLLQGWWLHTTHPEGRRAKHLSGVLRTLCLSKGLSRRAVGPWPRQAAC